MTLRTALPLVVVCAASALPVFCSPAWAAAPEAPDTRAASGEGTSTVVVHGVLDPVASSTEVVVEYGFFYAPRGAACSEAFFASESPGLASGAQGEAVELTLSGLEPNTPYAVCLAARNPGEEGWVIGNAVAFSTLPAPPSVLGESAASNSTEATLYAEVNANNENTSYEFEYSTSEAEVLAGNGTKLPGGSELEGGSPQTVEAPTGAALSPGTTYYYRVVAENTQSKTEPHPAEGAVKSFTTDPTPHTDLVTGIGTTTATFNGHLALDATATSYSFDYKLGGSCTGESSTPSAEAASASVSSPVTGLQPGRLYTVCLVTANASGSQVGPPVSFKTLPETYVTDVGSSSATLHAVLDPEGSATTYSFQYGTTSGYGTETQQASAGSGSAPVSVEAHIQGLAADTVYHFRVIGSVGAAAFQGADASFTTQPAATAFSLLDAREWEQVSPPDKHGASIEPLNFEGGVVQAAEGGGAITYTSEGSIVPEPEGNRTTEVSQVLSKRGTEGWSSEDIATPHSDVGFFQIGAFAEYEFFSPDLSLGLVEPRGETPLPPLKEGAEKTIYERNDDDCEPTPTEAIPATCYLPLVTTANVEIPGSKLSIPPTEDQTNTSGHHIEFEGASPDLSHVVFGEDDGEPLTKEDEGGDLYEWAAGRLSVVSVLPGGGGPTGGELGGLDHRVVRHAVSENGSRVVWLGTSTGHLYLRDMESKETVELDEPEPGCASCGTENAQPHFQTASSDGSRVFFTDRAQLTADSTASVSASTADLYVFELTSGAGEPLAGRVNDLTVDREPGERAAVEGEVIGTSEDGTYVYFVANGVLGDAGDHGAAAGNCAISSTISTGTCNLYVERYRGGGWEEPVFIATLSGEDGHDYEPYGGLPTLTARVSPDGQWLAFMSDRRLTGYDNSDAASGVPDEEVYLFDEATGRLVCASCNPTGERPAGVFDPAFRTEKNTAPLLVDERDAWGGHWLAGSVPGWTPDNRELALYQSRYLSDSGRLFFDSPDSLVPADVDGKENVYEFEPVGVGGCREGAAGSGEVFAPAAAGCVGLVSSGTSSQESEFLDATGVGPGGEEGEEVFFLTASQLVAGDTDDAFDVYDAHSCSTVSPCIAASTVAAAPPCTTADSCRAAPAPQPSIYGAPPSATFSGPGNLAPPPPTAVKPKLETKAEKLAKALRACRKDKRKSRRMKCERAARKAYSAKTTVVDQAYNKQRTR